MFVGTMRSEPHTEIWCARDISIRMMFMTEHDIEWIQPFDRYIVHGFVRRFPG